jgi:uncharacterized membrane protein
MNEIQPGFSTTTAPINSSLGHGVNVIDALISVLVRLGLIAGLIKLFLKRKKHYANYLTFSVGFLGVLLLFIVFPSISDSYNLERLYQTALLIFALPIVIGVIAMSNPLKKVVPPILVVSLVVVLYFFYNSGVLNNYGHNYDHDVTTSGDAIAATWIGKYDEHTAIYTDVTSIRGVQAYGGTLNIYQTLLPVAIQRNSYVFISSANLLHDVAFASGLTYTPPIGFLNADKNVVYTNSQAEIYR